MSAPLSPASQWPSIKNFVGGVAFASDCHFAEANEFVDAALEAAGCTATKDWADASGAMTAFIREWGDIDAVISDGLTPDRACRYLLARDLGRVCEQIEVTDPRLLSPDSIDAAAAALMNIAEMWGLDVAYAHLRVQDQFPSPHEAASFAAMTYDRGDQRLHGIEPGVVLLRDQLRPLYSVGLLAHEFTHLVFGRIDTNILARGLEEGLADFVGQLMFAGEILPRDVAERLLWNSRARYGRSQLGRLYRDSLVAACGVYLVLGDEAFKSLVLRVNREGRTALHQLEREFAGGSLQLPSSSAGAQKPFAMRFLSMTPDLVVSPLAFVVAERVAVGDDVDLVKKRLNISGRDLKKALAELQDRVFIAVESDGVVTSNEGPFYIGLGQLRYDALGRTSDAR